jgi:hypothetical protein
MKDIIYKGWKTQGWRRLGGNPRTVAPDDFAIRGGPTTPITNILLPFFNTPAVTTKPLQILRLDQNSLNIEERSPFVKMSANCDVVGTWRMRT